MDEQTDKIELTDRDVHVPVEGWQTRQTRCLPASLSPIPKDIEPRESEHDWQTGRAHRQGGDERAEPDMAGKVDMYDVHQIEIVWPANMLLLKK